MATLLAESAWLYALFGVVGLAMGLDGSPIGWLAVLVVLVTAFVVTRLLQLIVMPMAVASAVAMLLGAVTLYMTFATQFGNGQGLDLAWVGGISSGAGGKDSVSGVVFGTVFGVLLWWRGARLASAFDLAEWLGDSFRLGMLVLAIAAVVDVFNREDLNVFEAMFLFFGAGLAGMSLVQVLPASAEAVAQRTWLRVIGGVVSVVVFTGLLLTLLEGTLLSLLSRPAQGLLNLFFIIFFYVLVVPVAYVVGFIMRLVLYLLSRINVVPEGVELDDSVGLGESFVDLQQGEVGASALVTVIEWVLVAVAVGIVLMVLAKTFRRRIRLWGARKDGTHESVMENADPANDLARLLLKLLPRAFTGSKGPRSFRLPGGEADVVDVFKVYFGMLVLAEKRGFPRPPTETPEEYAATLEGLFPREVVRTVTVAFVRACYGHHPASRRQIDEMRSSLERLSAEPG